MTQKRKLSRYDRKVYRRNALLGTKEWMKESRKRREVERKRKDYGWGFEGRSPRTKPREHHEHYVHSHIRHHNGKEVHVRGHWRHRE